MSCELEYCRDLEVMILLTVAVVFAVVALIYGWYINRKLDQQVKRELETVQQRLRPYTRY